eukprot:205401-Amphidinium_carterae.2
MERCEAASARTADAIQQAQSDGAHAGRIIPWAGTWPAQLRQAWITLCVHPATYRSPHRATH